MGQAVPAITCQPLVCQQQAEAFSSLVVRHLMEAEAPFGPIDEANCRLLHSSEEGNVEGIMEALVDGADINTRLPVWIRMRITENWSDFEEEIIGDADLKPNATGLTPLMKASYAGHVNAVQCLLAHNAQLDLCDGDGMQAIHLAVHAASAECLRVLLEVGANPLAKDDFGRTALQCVSTDGSLHSSAQLELMASLMMTGNFTGCSLELAEEADVKAAVVAGTSNKATTTAAPSEETHCEVERAIPAVDDHDWEAEAFAYWSKDDSVDSNSTAATLTGEKRSAVSKRP